MSGKMSKKILSRKWDVWQERLGWEGCSHLLEKMCPQNPSLVKRYTAHCCWVVIVRCDQMMGMSRMCWSILSDKGLYLCHSKWRPPELTSGHSRSGSGWWLQIVWDLWNESLWLKLIVLSKKCEMGTSDRRLIRSNWLFAGLRGFMRAANTWWLMPLNIKIRPPADDKHLILGVVWCLFGQQMG